MSLRTPTKSPLDQVFRALMKTKHHLFIVVNEFEEVVGLVKIEDVLEEIIGQEIIDEYDKFDDLRSVAKNIHVAKLSKVTKNVKFVLSIFYIYKIGRELK